MTESEAAKQCDEMASKVASVMMTLIDVKDTAEFIQSQMNDNGDPSYECSNAIAKVGELLGVIISYRDEYAKASQTV